MQLIFGNLLETSLFGFLFVYFVAATIEFKTDTNFREWPAKIRGILRKEEISSERK